MRAKNSTFPLSVTAMALDQAFGVVKRYMIMHNYKLIGEPLSDDERLVPLGSDSSDNVPTELYEAYQYYRGCLDITRVNHSVKRYNDMLPPFPRHFVSGVNSEFAKSKRAAK